MVKAKVSRGTPFLWLKLRFHVEHHFAVKAKVSRGTPPKVSRATPSAVKAKCYNESFLKDNTIRQPEGKKLIEKSVFKKDGK